VTRLVLVRHGESNATVLRVAGGLKGCTGLSPLGRDQALALRDRWLTHPEVDADVLVASDLRRAVETAELIAPALGHLAVEVDDGLREMDPGPECDGLSWDDIVQRVESSEWESDPYHYGFPGGETLAGFQHRAAVALSALVRRYDDKTVVAVCHAGVIDVAFRLFLRVPFVHNFELRTVNTSITELTLVSPQWRLLRYNDAAHLAGLPHATPSG
jgi:broad specificity phosphatase PhoE